MAQGFHKPGGVEDRLGYYVGQNPREAPTPVRTLPTRTRWQHQYAGTLGTGEHCALRIRWSPEPSLTERVSGRPRRPSRRAGPRGRRDRRPAPFQCSCSDRGNSRGRTVLSPQRNSRCAEGCENSHTTMRCPPRNASRRWLLEHCPASKAVIAHLATALPCKITIVGSRILNVAAKCSVQLLNIAGLDGRYCCWVDRQSRAAG